MRVVLLQTLFQSRISIRSWLVVDNGGDYIDDGEEKVS
jgi:hypothetical protein